MLSSGQPVVVVTARRFPRRTQVLRRGVVGRRPFRHVERVEAHLVRTLLQSPSMSPSYVLPLEQVAFTDRAIVCRGEKGLQVCVMCEIPNKPAKTKGVS